MVYQSDSTESSPSLFNVSFPAWNPLLCKSRKLLLIDAAWMSLPSCILTPFSVYERCCAFLLCQHLSLSWVRSPPIPTGPWGGLFIQLDDVVHHCYQAWRASWEAAMRNMPTAPHSYCFKVVFLFSQRAAGHGRLELAAASGFLRMPLASHSERGFLCSCPFGSQHFVIVISGVQHLHKQNFTKGQERVNKNEIASPGGMLGECTNICCSIKTGITQVLFRVRTLLDEPC